MKIVITSLFAILVLFVLTNCNSEKATNNDTETDNDNKVEIVNEVEKVLLPENVDLNIPIPVGNLKEAFFKWSDQEVTITGYCDFFFDKGNIGEKVTLKTSPDAEEKLVECKMIQLYDEEFEKSIPVTIKGKISGTWQKTIELIDCEFISKGEDAKLTDIINPEKLPEYPMAVKDFHNSYFGWYDKEVTVVGYYQSTTTSTNDYGETIRIDLTDPNTNKKAVGCRMQEEPPENLKNNRNNVKIRGIIKGEVFGSVLMEECVLVQ